MQGKRFPECGSSDEQVDGCCKVAPVVALFAGHPDMLTTVDKVVRVTQNTDVASGFACGFARVLEKLVLGTASSLNEALCAAEAELLDAGRPVKMLVDADVAANLGRVMGEFSGLAHADVGMKLKPASSGFPFAGLA